MRLSICIPTYNRAEYLSVLLDSIVGQPEVVGCEVEVVISDNASTDATSEIIDRYRHSLPLLIYFRQEENRGPDRNFLKVIELATGNFCWFMGSDDALERGAITRIAKVLMDKPAIAGLSVERVMYDIDLQERFITPRNDRRIFTRSRLINDDREIFSSTADYFGYLSGNIVNRRLWNQVVNSEDVARFFNAYVHVFIMGRMIQILPEWYYLAEPCVKYRTGNDFFLKDGEFKRLKLDVDGYGQIVRSLYDQKSKTIREMDNRVIFHVRHKILTAKFQNLDTGFYKNVLQLSYRHYRRYPRFWLEVVPLTLVPSALVRFGRAAYRHTVRPVRIFLAKRRA